jgi:alpha-tubulin suppressor-like RCC1 family protein
VQVVVGRAYSCALMRDSTVRCWGDNAVGQLGIGTRVDGDHGVTTVPGLSGVIQLAGGYDQVCAVMRDGTVQCWGSNNYRFFLELNGPRLSPTTLPGLAGVVQLAMSINHACARLNDGSLRCWARNNFGQVGDGTISSSAALATPAGLPPVVDVSVGSWLTCARSASRSVWCWGWNLSGGVGDGTRDNTRTTPVRIIP